MNRKVIAVSLLSLVLGTGSLAAQQPQGPARDSAAQAAMMMNMQQHMRMMDSADARLDTLVRRMNSASGNAKVSAMAQVINELVAQRRAMQAHMRQMMQSHGDMMHGQMGPRARPGGDTSGHEEHH